MAVKSYALPFEKPIAELEKKLEELRTVSEGQGIDVSLEVERVQAKINETRRDIYAALTPWQKVQVARHPMRPYPQDYIQSFVEDFTELRGDRLFADDPAMIGGVGRIGRHRVMLIGTRKGRDTKSNLACHFGCALPEGYRKALRLMRMADKFGLPIVSLIDTPGAFPGIASEERHVAEAIAVNLREAFSLKVPMIAVVTGEGGSGGALGIGVGDRLLILEHAYYSVISPEGCAAILWKDRAYADRAAAALRLTADDLFRMDLADEVIEEPVGGAHSDPAAMATLLETTLVRHLDELEEAPVEELLKYRYEKFRGMGSYKEKQRGAWGLRV